MTYDETRSRIYIYRIAGFLIVAVCSITLAISLMKFFYYNLGDGLVIFGPFFDNLKRFIEMLYNEYSIVA